MTDIRKKLAGKATKLAQERPKQDDHPANLNDCREGSYYHLDINLILPDPDLPEKSSDPAKLTELAASIRNNRVYQPVVVRKNERGQIILVDGNRRLKAAKMAGLEKIPAIFTEGSPLEVSLILNLQSEELKDDKAGDEDGSLPPSLPGNDIERSEYHRKSQLLQELQNLATIIDKLIIK